jgi:hypothetical protein
MCMSQKLFIIQIRPNRSNLNIHKIFSSIFYNIIFFTFLVNYEQQGDRFEESTIASV